MFDNKKSVSSFREDSLSLYQTRQEGKQRIDDQPGREVPSFLAWFPFLSSWYGALAFIRNLPIELSSFSGEKLSQILVLWHCRWLWRSGWLWWSQGHKKGRSGRVQRQRDPRIGENIFSLFKGYYAAQRQVTAEKYKQIHWQKWINTILTFLIFSSSVLHLTLKKQNLA